MDARAAAAVAAVGSDEADDDDKEEEEEDSFIDDQEVPGGWVYWAGRAGFLGSWDILRQGMGL